MGQVIPMWSVMPAGEPLVDKKTVARHFSVTTTSIDNWCREGMPWHRRGRRRGFRISECEGWHADRFE